MGGTILCLIAYRVNTVKYLISISLTIFYLLLLTACSGNGTGESLIGDNAEKYAVTPPDTLNAIPANYFAEQIDNSKGLSNSSVNCVFQDSQNLLWTGTWDGLNRYDGNSFKIYRPEPANSHSISNQVILKVFEDKQGYIWVLTMNGINRYDKKTDRFTSFLFTNNNRPPLSESQFNMALSPQGNVFCAVKNWGLGFFNGTDFTKLKTGNAKLNAALKIAFLPSGQMLAHTTDGNLYQISFTIKGDTAVVKESKLISEKVKAFDILKNTIAVIAQDGRSYYVNAASNSKEVTDVHVNVTEITGQTPDGFVIPSNKGYAFLNQKAEITAQPWLDYLKNHKITTVVKGSENIIWAGTDGDGLIKIYPLKKTFGNVGKPELNGLDGGIVRAFLNDGSSFWVATKGKGLFKLENDFYKENTLTFQNFNQDNSLLNNSVFALHKTQDNLILIGTDGEGISVYDPIHKKITGWKSITGSNNCSYFRSVYTIYQDNEGYIWLGTNGYGMIRCKIKRSGNGLAVSSFKSYTAATDESNTLSNNIVFAITPRNNSQLWIGTRLGGLNLFDKKSGKFRVFKNIPGNPKSLSNNDVLCLATGAGNKLWIGTSYGLNVLEGFDGSGNAQFKNFTVKNGLPNNTIHGVVPATATNIWISTNAGLSNFSPRRQKFINYTQNEGLQNNEFADGAFYNDTLSGFIYMGGIKGFNYFLPDKVKESPLVPNLLIDRISGQNQALPYYQGLVIAPSGGSTAAITLKHNQNFFDIHHTALSFINNEKCRYVYQLKGFDKEWNNIGNRKIISFTNVPKGEYSLWMKWSNSDGVWSNPVHAIDITVKPVWWQSNLALFIYTVLAVGFILFVRSYYLKKQSLQQNILFRKREEELHENRLAFFTNIAHEFLTPLTLIVGPAQKLSETASFDGKSHKYMNMIQRNASRLLFLTQQLLEFRKAEHDYLGVSVRQFDLVGLIEQIAELFDDLALDKNINYSVSIQTELNGWYDKDKLEKIVFNLMSNAFKYTPQNGSISLKCHTETKNNRLAIIITNTGKGISKEKLDSLFDRFFLTDANVPADTEMFRTGIGLAYIKKLVTVLRGEIQVSSIPDKETTFTILLPCSQNDFKENEIDKGTLPVLISPHLKNILEDTSEKSETVPEKIAALESIENERKTILVVEDEKEIHSYLHDLLADRYELIAAYNGQEALELIENKLPDLIISDVMMPVMDGVELCKRIKTTTATCHIPFIMLTAKSSVIHRIEGLESGANSYIPKPFYPEHLLVRIEKLLEEKALILKHFTQDTLIENLTNIPVAKDDKAFIKQLIELIRKNIDNENLNAAFAEKELGISSSQLYRKTKENFNLSPGDLIRTIRLKHAAELLRKNELTVSEVCYKSGFNNRSYFYREFKKVYNDTPKNYQLLYKAKSSNFSKN
jgi:signal transduction histidine kinase/ligand-binding sensor domain-containing protein/AraC-like DNA-binding protein